jgi:hypothetical protein
MYNFEDMVNEVENLLKKETLKEIRKEFVNTPKTKLVMYHGTLGRTIRNEYKLWETHWTPDIRDGGVDYSPDHPDQVSMRVIGEVWERLKNG